MNDLLLELQERDVDGKKVARLRKENLIPSIVYGGQSIPLMTQSPIVETTKLAKIAGKHTPIKIVIDGKKKLAIIKSIDVDPIKHSIRHLAFHTIKQNDIITAEVPIVLTGEGESLAERAGLIVLQAIEKIEVKAKPADLPESLDVSILNLANEDDKLTIADIKLPSNVEYADIDQDMDLAIASVYEPGALQAGNEAAGGDEDAAIENVEIISELEEAEKSEK